MHKGLDRWVNGWIGSYKRRNSLLNQWQSEVSAVEALEKPHKDMGDRVLREKLVSLREAFRRGGARAEASMVEGLAAIREASDRQLGMRPFPVQLLGALALNRGCLTEMATGEGKTLTAGLAGVLAGWTRHPCHIVTVNDYLVQRDATWLGPLYEFCGVRVGYVTSAMKPEERRKGYAADVAYTTSKELLADFLRDSIVVGEARDPSRRLIRQMLRPSKWRRKAW